MPDDQDMQTPHHRSWFERISHAFHHEPHNLPELRSLLRETVNNKIINIDALEMIEGVLSISQMQVRDIMIPRAQMVVVELNQTPEVFLPILVETAHSRFPVIGENKDDILGILLAKDLLKQMLVAPNQPLRLSLDMLRPAIYVPESKRLDALLRQFRSSRNHLAIVVDEYGGIAGLVTIEDVLEEIVGDIEDEYDTDEEDFITPVHDKAFLVDALTPLEVFNEHFNTAFPDTRVDTIGGYITQHFGRVPQEGEEVTLDNLTFIIAQADDRRVISLRLEMTEAYEA